MRKLKSVDCVVNYNHKGWKPLSGCRQLWGWRPQYHLEIDHCRTGNGCQDREHCQEWKWACRSMIKISGLPWNILMHQFNHIMMITCNVNNTCSWIYSQCWVVAEVVKKLTIGNVIKFSNYKSSVLHTELRVSTLVLFIIILFTWLSYSCLNQGNWVCDTVSKAKQHLYKGSKWLLARVEIYALHLRNSQGRRERQPRLIARFT